MSTRNIYCSSNHFSLLEYMYQVFIEKEIYFHLKCVNLPKNITNFIGYSIQVFGHLQEVKYTLKMTKTRLQSLLCLIS
jgi:hypothetical protein